MHFSQLRAGLVVTLFFSSSMAAPTGLAKKSNTADSVASSAPILPECDTTDCDNTQASELTSGQFPRRHWHDSNEWQAPAGCEGAECNSDDWWAMEFDGGPNRKERRDEKANGELPRRHWHDSNNEWQAPAGCEGAECNSDDWWAMAFDTSAGGRKVRRDPHDPFSSSCRFDCVSSEFP